jgi:3-oxoacyl-[acyl-carrier-protein] synthase II
VVVGLSSAGSDELGSDETAGIYPRLAVRFAGDARPLPTLLYDEVSDFAYLRGLPSMAGQFVARVCGFCGSNVAVNGEGAAGGLGALALAARLVTSGELDRVMVVGVAPARTRSGLAAADRAEPLARSHGSDGGGGPTDGVVAAEGAAAVLIEDPLAARARGAVALARLSGCETICASDRRTALETAVALASPRSRDLTPVAAPWSRPIVGTAFECAGLIDVVLAVEILHRGRGGSAQPPVLVTATDHGLASGGAGAALVEELIDEVGR